MKIYQSKPLYGDNAEVAHLAGLMYEPGEEGEDDGDDDDDGIDVSGEKNNNLTRIEKRNINFFFFFFLGTAADLADRLKPTLKKGGKMTSRGLKKLAHGIEKGVVWTGEKTMSAADSLSSKGVDDNETSTVQKRKEKKKDKKDKKDKGKEDEDTSMMVDWAMMDEVNQEVVEEDEQEAIVKKFANLKEIFIYRRRKVVHVYDVIEMGRRYYRSLVFSSDNR